MSTPKTYPFTWTRCSQKEQEGKLLLGSFNNYMDQILTFFFTISEYDSIYVAERSFYHSMIKSSPMGLMAPYKLEWNAEKIWNFKPRKDDIWIVTYPKCGTTLTQEIVWQIAHGVDLGGLHLLNLLAIESRDLSQAENEITTANAEQIQRMTTFLTLNLTF